MRTLPINPFYFGLFSAIINVIIVYAAAFSYRLSWQHVLGVMVGISILWSLINRGLEHLYPATKKDISALYIQKVLSMAITGLIASIIVLVMLSIRFGLPMAIGIVILNGIISGILNMIQAYV